MAEKLTVNATLVANSTALETFALVLPPYFYTINTVIVESLMGKQSFILELFTLILPLVLNATILSNNIIEVWFTCMAILLALFVLLRRIKTEKIKPAKNRLLNYSHFITNTRSIINMGSVIAILAVDFKMFPGRFSKTATFGYSLMDLGVGFYVFSNGIVAPEIRHKGDSVLKSIKDSIPLFLIGLLRCLLTKQLNYGVPVSEYGVHWNFFITLAITKIFTSMIMNVVNIKYIYINASLLIIAHEILLKSGLENFVFQNSKRDNLIKANKEGLISTLGYVSIYLFSAHFGYLLHQMKLDFKKIYHMISFSIGSLILSLILEHFCGISRRLANSSYCFWVLFNATFMTLLLLFSELALNNLYKNKVKTPIYSPIIHQSINYNGLVYFLVANLLTGAVNLSIDTLKAPWHVTLVILCIYMAFNCLVVFILFKRQVKLKL